MMQKIFLHTFILFTLLTTYSHAGLRDLNIDFHKSMCSHKNHELKQALKDYRWKMGERLYNRHILENLTFSNEAQIPKIVHHIWLGSTLPQYAKDFRKTWIKKNPDWTFVLWTDHPIYEYDEATVNTYAELASYLSSPNKKQFIVVNTKKLDIINKKPFYKIAKNYGEKSDILRYEILYHIGGLYVDTDFECLQPYDEIHHCCEFYAGVAHDKEFLLYNGLIGSAPGSPILSDAIKNLKNRKRKEMDSLEYSGPTYFTDCFIRVMEKKHEKTIAIPFPVTFFYPWPNTERFQKYKKARKWIKKESYGLHYWKVSWNK
jgi:inositol phosphorylceramide mannosyltransferase catalytic subunit